MASGYEVKEACVTIIDVVPGESGQSQVNYGPSNSSEKYPDTDTSPARISYTTASESITYDHSLTHTNQESDCGHHFTSQEHLHQGEPTVYVGEKPNDYMELSILACCLNFLVGLVALKFSINSREAYRNGNFKQAKSQGRSALFCSLLGLAVIALTIVLLCWFLIPRTDTNTAA